ncbi:hypothetical protein ABIA33_000765 [Streptacidiphilus sp. MAP12-16]|jgi:hypothetical protein|uniref:hypothetical protein n=1 Tax=Streptacidiphilus sp. MAP12-16 TaxID=3156300 RepID=UPI003512A417
MSSIHAFARKARTAQAIAVVGALTATLSHSGPAVAHSAPNGASLAGSAATLQGGYLTLHGVRSGTHTVTVTGAGQ